MNIEIRSIDSVTPYDKNPRKVPQKAIDAVANSLRLYGFRQPIVVDKDGVIIAGHTRRLGAQQLGMTEIPVHVADLSPEQARAYRLADNQTRELTDWDDDALAQELYELSQSSDEGLAQLAEMTAFDESALRKMIDAVNPPDEETPLEAEPEPRSERGQVWQLGKHRLMCGDSGVKEDVDRLLDGAEPRLMVTDPPYGVDYDASWRDESLSDATRRVGQVSGDHSTDWSPTLEAYRPAVVYVWSPPGDHQIAFANILMALEYQIRNQIVWRKQNHVISRGHYHWQHEPCWYAVRKGEQAGWIGDRSQTSVWDITWDKNVGMDQGGHSTQKPLECMERPIRNHEGDVYDPFVGSGTTIIAAERQGRACYAMELEPRYVDMAIARWEQYTSGTAVLVD